MRALVVVVLAFLVGGCVAGVATSGRIVLKDDTASVDVRFTDRDRALIDEYYKSKPGRKSVPPGLARRDRLPPGLAHDPLPRELEVKLSALPGSYVRVRIGGDIVLMDGKTRVIFDVIYGVVDQVRSSLAVESGYGSPGCGV